MPAGQPSHSVLLSQPGKHRAGAADPLQLGDRVTLPHRALHLRLAPARDRGAGPPRRTPGAGGQRRQARDAAALGAINRDGRLAGVFDFYLHQMDDRTLELRLPLEGRPRARPGAQPGRAASLATAMGTVPRSEVRVLLGQSVPRGRSGRILRIVAAPQGWGERARAAPQAHCTQLRAGLCSTSARAPSRRPTTRPGGFSKTGAGP